MPADLPTFEQVPDDVVAILLEVFGSPDGYKQWLKYAILEEVRVRKLQPISEAYVQAIADIGVQEAAARAAVEARLEPLVSIVTGTPPAIPPEEPPIET